MPQENALAIPPGGPVEYLTPNGKFVKQPDGRLIFVPGGGTSSIIPTTPTPPPGGPGAEGQPFERDIASVLKGVTLASGFVPQFKALGAAGKALPFLAPMAAGALEGAFDPERTALEEGGMQGAMEAVSRRAAPAIRYGGARVGVALGGLGKNLREHAPDIAAATARLKEQLTPGDPISYIKNLLTGKLGESVGIPLGSAKGTSRALGKVGEQIEQFGESRPEMINLQDLQGASQRQQLDALYTARPEDLAQRLAGQESDIINQHIGARNIQPYGPQGPNPNVTFREAQKVKSGLSSAASDVYQRAAQPGWDPASVIPDAKQLAALARRIKELQERALGGQPAALEEMKRLNSLFADLSLKQQAEQAMRGGGNVIGDVGQLSVRGGLSGAVSGGAAGMLGGDPRTAGLIGGLLGMTILNPKASSLGGFLLGDAARAAPTVVRGADILSEEEKKPVRRRTPGGR